MQISDQPKQDFMAEAELKLNFGYHSSFGQNRSTKKIEIYFLCITKRLLTNYKLDGIFGSMVTFQIIIKICYKCLTCYFLLVCNQ